MKIAYIIPSLKNKGPIIVVKELVENLLILGVRPEDILIYYFDESDEVKFPVRTKKIRLSGSIDINKYDIVHSHMLRPDIYLLKEKILNILRLKRTTAKLITTLHQRNYENLFYESEQKIQSRVIAFIWEFAISSFDRVVVLSQSMKEYYWNRLIFGKNNLEVVWNGRNIEQPFKATHKLNNNQDNQIVLGTACNLNKIKNLDIVLLAISRVSNAVFHIIGDGDEKMRLQAVCNDLNIQKRVYFWGYKKDALIYFKYFDIFILPSKSEGMSLSLIEAAAMRKAIICSDIESNHDMFENDEAVFFDNNSVEDLVDKIAFVNLHKTEYAERAYKKYIAQYTGLAMAKKYYKLYGDII